MALHDQINIPNWTVCVQAVVTLVIPLLISSIFNRYRQADDE